MATKTMEIPFFSRFNRPTGEASPTGTKYDKTYAMIIDENGHKTLRCTGETNRYEKVQSYKEECLIENILAKAQIDPTILNKKQGMYFDATEAPKTLAEAQNRILALNQEFNKLPVEVRAKFDHSPEKYVMEYGTEKWGLALGIVKEKVEEKTKEETKGEEVNE